MVLINIVCYLISYLWSPLAGRLCPEKLPARGEEEAALDPQRQVVGGLLVASQKMYPLRY